MKESVKHRLIGGAVLASVAVLFLPSFFKDRQQYQVDTHSQIPERPVITAVALNEPEQVDAIEPAPAPETMFVPDDMPVLESAASSVAQSSAATQSSAARSSQAALATSDALLPEGWVIQLVSLSSQEAANRLRDQLQASGHRAYARAVPLADKTVYRVFIGPKQTKAEAMQLKAQLDAQLKVNSSVLPFKP